MHELSTDHTVICFEHLNILEENYSLFDLCRRKYADNIGSQNLKNYDDKGT